MASKGPYGAHSVPDDDLTPQRVTRFRTYTRPEGDCLQWTGGTTGHRSHPYGQFRIGARMYTAHRIAWQIDNGPIPDGYVIDHLCRNTLCVNTTHMNTVTQGENVRRAGQVRTRSGQFTNLTGASR